MALMYLAKVNLTSAIFDVYESKLNIMDVTKSIYDQFDNKTTYKVTANQKYIDEYGNRKRFNQVSTYQLVEIKKEQNMIITGKVVRTFLRPTEKIDEKGHLLSTYNEEKVGIYFYYDVKNEMIAFSERQSFGYNQFINAFTYMINQNREKNRFEIFLQKDNDLLQEKIRGFQAVHTVKATLIPPNSIDDDLRELQEVFGLRYMEECHDANANKLKIEMSVDDPKSSLKMESKYMKDIYTAVSRGYGDLTTIGVGKDGKKRIIKSNTDAALTKIVDEKLLEPEYNKEAHGFIYSFLESVKKRSKI